MNRKRIDVLFIVAGLTVLVSFIAIVVATLGHGGPAPVEIAFGLIWSAVLSLVVRYAWRQRVKRRLERSRSLGVCSKCGYSLAGLPAGLPCPECGKASTESTLTTSASGS